MKKYTQNSHLLGVDFGSDSARALLVRASDGQIVSEATTEYPRWARGLYCDPSAKQFRQHPLDYLDALRACVKEVCKIAGPQITSKIAALSIDTTGSTPCPADRSGTPLALLPTFAENPNAMFHLWKDHTAGAEAAEITAAFTSGTPDYTVYQGAYSSEWYWAKILHTVRCDRAVREAAYTWVEHCDWMSNLLAGTTKPELAYRCACAAGHKAYWHSAWGGLPAKERLARIDPYLAQVHDTFFQMPQPCAHVLGSISPEWARQLGLPLHVKICGGSFDAHAGAVGAGVCAGTMVINLGTSAVNMMVEKAAALRGTGFSYLAGQAENSILPGYVGIETSQSAFGDTYAWLKHLLLWPVNELLNTCGLTPEQRQHVAERAETGLLPMLEQAAKMLPPQPNLVALDWFNGRRYPYNNDLASSAICGLHLGVDAPTLYRALIEATAYGQRRLIDGLTEHGLHVRRIVAVGGIAQKSPFVMQTLSDVLQRTIAVNPVSQTCALGAAIYAGVGAGIYESVEAAQKSLCRPCEVIYQPDPSTAAYHEQKYQRYCALSKKTDPMAFGS